MSYAGMTMPQLDWRIGDDKAHTNAKQRAAHYLMDNGLIDKPMNTFTAEQVDTLLYVIWDTFVTSSQYNIVKLRKEHQKWCDDEQPPF